jgi:hypothetical protein
MLASLLVGLTTALTPVHLDVERADDDGACPDADALAAAVQARVGAGAVVAGAHRRIVVDFVRAGDGWAGDVRMFDGDAERGRRALGPAADCAAVAEAVVLTVSLVVDPLLPLRPAAPPPTTTTTTPAPTAPPPTTTAPTAPPPTAPPSPTSGPLPRRGVAWAAVEADAAAADARAAPRWQPAAVLSTGAAGGVAPGEGAVVGVGVVVGPRRAWSVGADAALLLPRPLPVDGVRRVEAQALLLGVDACLEAALVSGCLGVGAGALRAVGTGFAAGVPVVAPTVVPRGRFVVRAPLVGGATAFAAVELGVPVLRAALLDGRGVQVWESAPLALDVRVGVTVPFAIDATPAPAP